MTSPQCQLSQELETARDAVVRAARLTKTVLCSVSELSKADSSPVTVADFAAQALLISILHAAFPDDAFVGEEDAAALRADAALAQQVYELFLRNHPSSSSSSSSSDHHQQHHNSKRSSSNNNNNNNTTSSSDQNVLSMEHMLDMIDLGGRGQGGPRGRFWVMDPVDGTATFLTGQQYAVSLALVQDGHEVLAAIVYPNLRLTSSSSSSSSSSPSSPEGRVHENSIDSEGLGALVSGVKGSGSVQVSWLTSWDGPYDYNRDHASDHNHNHPISLETLTQQQQQNHHKYHVVDCDGNRASHRAAMAQVCEKLGHTPFPGTDVWSSHMRYASLLLGGGDFFVRIPSGPESWSCIWDHAGAQMLYRELGGRATDLDGREVDFGAGRYLSRNRGLVLARNEDLHAKLLAAARDVIGAEGYVP
ncbi:Inositol monophosphatase [Moelleriella libera RCEF 2490]|uniref:Inositol monophosphatase n=1 Tax=Moelleriella libera RCEF 2490 TaxID=1081109 RepID=A0A166UQI4_9HYPO|nr:Inositol monophosphatase [Moelleriella libera RCEF 2490]